MEFPTSFAASLNKFASVTSNSPDILNVKRIAFFLPFRKIRVHILMT